MTADTRALPQYADSSDWLRYQEFFPEAMRFISKMNRISNIPELAELCSTDPLGGANWVPARFLRTLVESAPDIEPEDFEVCPVFQALRDEVRRELADQYLGQGMSLAEISFLLGFSEPSAFFRAFKRWTGLTPLERRGTLVAG